MTYELGGAVRVPAVPVDAPRVSSSPRHWLRHTRPVPAGSPRLLCLPSAGRGATMYEDWPARLAPAVEAWPVQLPGREDRSAEPPLTEMDTLTGALLTALDGCLETPYALMGCGTGATIAVALAFRVRRLGMTEPVHVFVVGQPPPHLPATAPLPDGSAADLALVRRYECVPDPALICPITVFDDESVPPHLLMAWGRLTHGAFRVRPAADVPAQIRAAL